MNNFEEQLNRLEKELDAKIDALEVLEAEKSDIKTRYINSDKTERVRIEKEMKASEEKFRTLAEETFLLKEKIKKLK